MDLQQAASYPLPLETLPGLDLSYHLADIVETRDFLEGRGLNTKNTRIERYITYLQETLRESQNDASKVFKNSVDIRFQHPIDWLLYVLREVHELAWILKGLRVSIPSGVDEKLKVIVAGRDFAALDSDSQSRNTQFELRIASYFLQAGCEVDLSQDTDIVALTSKHAFYLECKRIGSEAQLSKRLAEAKKQLLSRMPKKAGKRNVLGCVAADVTKVAFSHNGLTFGATPDHSRHVIQEKLVRVAQTAQKLPLFRECGAVYCYWLQIHIPALVLQPSTASTRFSSYHLLRRSKTGREQRAASVFYEIFEEASKKTDERETPAQKLRPRTGCTLPAGTSFGLTEGFVEDVLAGEIGHREGSEVVGTLSMDGTEHRFTLFEFRMLATSSVEEIVKDLSQDRGRGALHLLVLLYLQRFPYEESEPDGTLE